MLKNSAISYKIVYYSKRYFCWRIIDVRKYYCFPDTACMHKNNDSTPDSCIIPIKITYLHFNTKYKKVVRNSLDCGLDLTLVKSLESWQSKKTSAMFHAKALRQKLVKNKHNYKPIVWNNAMLAIMCVCNCWTFSDSAVGVYNRSLDLTVVIQ